jgi:hypothetical protein
MRTFQLIDIPQKVSLDTYKKSIDQMLHILEGYSQIKSVYQVGSIRTPGISDIDFIVVFDDNNVLNDNPRNQLTSEEKYLFSHDLFGVSEKHWHYIEKYNLFGKYNHLLGQELKIKEAVNNDALKKQQALEYLIKAWVSMSLDVNYRILKVRNFLLHIKGIRIDLEWLGYHDHSLHAQIEKVILMREQWFQTSFSAKEITHTVLAIYEGLDLFLTEYFQDNCISIPTSFSGKLYRNIQLVNGEKGCQKQGFVYPFPVRSFVKDKRGYNLLNKFNQFIFSVPMCNTIDSEIEEKFSFYENYQKENRKNTPHFGVCGNVLNLY